MKLIPVLLAILSFSAVSATVPRKTEAALRARVDEFYGLIINHKTRAAEALVAEDSKDYYYDSQKPAIESFEIGKINYGPGFKTADVSIEAKMHMMFPGVGPQTVPMKFPSTWKLENGKWCWYVDKSRIMESPFGQLRTGSGGAEEKPIVTPDMLAASVRADRNQISLNTNGQQIATINFTNSLPGPITLHAPEAPGVKIEIANTTVPAGKSTVVTFRVDTEHSSKPATLTFTVDPTGQKIPIQVIYFVQNK